MNQQQIWDKWNESGGPRYPHELVVQFFFRNFPPSVRSSTHVLDLGCGSGANTAFLAREGFVVSGCDISAVALDNTRRRLESESLSADLRLRAIADIDFAPATFDAVVSFGVLDSAGIAQANMMLHKLPVMMKKGAIGLFVFASDSDARANDSSCPFRLHGYSRNEVESLFGPAFKKVWYDRYIRTYENGRIQWNDWLITVFAL